MKDALKLIQDALDDAFVALADEGLEQEADDLLFRLLSDVEHAVVEAQYVLRSAHE